MSYLDNVPDEIINSIILECSYKSIINFWGTCHRFNKLNIKSLLKKKSYFGFPRIRAKVHTIPKLILPSDDMILQALKHLIDNEVDVIYGDIIISPDGREVPVYKKLPSEFIGFRGMTGCAGATGMVGDVGIITGTNNINFQGLTGEIGATGPRGVSDDPKWIFGEFELFKISNYDPIPKTFRVIENNVPIKYWDVKVEEYGKLSNYIWFDHNLFKEQCLMNIKSGPILNYSKMLYTTFIYDDNEYTITCTDYYNIDKFKELLSSDDLIKFKRLDDYSMMVSN